VTEPDGRYDYIIVGAGTAGCVVAGRLSEDPDARVLLLEAGGLEPTRATTVPHAWPENLGSSAEWNETTTPQGGGVTIAYSRGRVLGGSGAINAMAHVRGHRSIYDGWARDGAPGWGFADLLPFFRRTERTTGRDPELRGTDGPIPVGPPGSPHPVARAFVQGLRDAGVSQTDDLSGAHQEGVCWADLAISDGRRVSSADAYVRPVLDRPNLTVAGGSHVLGLRLDDGRCTGVGYLDDGVPTEASAEREVVLCAGAIGSPQLLLRSGIGGADALRSLGIEVVADRPSVGANLHDHAVVYTSHASPAPLPTSLYNNGEAYAALRSSLAADAPDLHLFPILLPIAAAGCEPPAAGFVLTAAVMQPESRGSVTLRSADPAAAPVIDPALLREERDLDRMEEAATIARELGASSAMRACRRSEVWPGPEVTTRAALRDWLRAHVWTYYHPAGTCRMGGDADSVVDLELRLRGVDGLRVADASVMPRIPNAHPNATVLAIGERAAELIRQG
jgi:choline dehydrogenase